MTSPAAWLRKTFIQGILLILPLAITWLILRWIFRLVIGLSAPLVNRLLTETGIATDDPLSPWLTPFVAVALTIGLVLLVGVVGGNYVGRRALAAFELLVMRLPLVKWFYGSARQLMDALRATGGGAFREVVFVEYPRRGMWTLGFVTASATGAMPGRPEEDSVYVFIPTTPNPTSGYTVLIARSEAPPARMSVDEGLKLIVSGGFIAPAPHRPGVVV